MVHWVIPVSGSKPTGAPSGAAQAMIRELHIPSFTIPQEQTQEPAQRIIEFGRQ